MENDGDKGLPFPTRKMFSFQEGKTFGLRIKSQANIASTIYIRGMTKEGIFTYKHVTTNDGIVQTDNFRIPDVPIFVSVIDELGAYTQAKLYVELSLTINNDQLFALCAGWVYYQKSISYPAVSNPDKRPGQGQFRLYTNAQPAAHTEHQWVVPDGQTCRIIGVQVNLVTDANVANRRVHLQCTSGGDYVFDLTTAIDQTASLTRKYWASAAPYGPGAVVNTSIYVPLPANVILMGSNTIETLCDNFQAGDRYSSMKIYVEQLIGTN